MPAVWYPGAKVRLQIRFEDFLPTPPPPAVPGVPGPLGPEMFGPGSAAVPPVFASVGLDVAPRTCNVEINSYRQADEARVVLPLTALPFDPRIIRAMTMQVFGGSFTPSEWAEANGPVGAAGLVLPDTVPLGRGESGKSNEIFRGFVDTAEMTLSGADTLSLTARDLTGPLLDAEIPEDYLTDLPLTLPLDLVIQLLITGDGAPTPELSRRFGLPGMRGVLVINDTEQIVLPTIAAIRPPTWLDSKKTTRRGRKNPPGSGQKQSYWDVITDLVVSAGFIVFMRPGEKVIPGTNLLPAAEIVISDPRTYYKDDLAGSIENAIPGTIRQFIYGKNIEELKITRKLGGVKTPAIEVRTLDVDTGESVIARHPPLLLKKNNTPSASGIGDREEVKTFVLDEISGPNAQAQVELVAKSIYEQLGRGEMKVQFTTKVMAGLPLFASSGIEADMFRLRPGDTITILIDSADVEAGQVSAYTLFSTGSAAQRIERMLALGIPVEVAIRAAAAMDNPFIQTEFRTQKISCAWDHKSGWQFSVAAINYLDVRDATSPL